MPAKKHFKTYNKGFYEILKSNLTPTRMDQIFDSMEQYANEKRLEDLETLRMDARRSGNTIAQEYIYKFCDFIEKEIKGN